MRRYSPVERFHRRKLVKISGGGLNARGSQAAEGVSGCGGTMASAEHEPIMRVWGKSPQRGPGAEPLVRGAKPP